MELGPQNHNGDGLLGLNSIIVVFLDPLGYCGIIDVTTRFFSNFFLQGYPSSEYSSLIRRHQTKKGERVLLRNQDRSLWALRSEIG